MKTRHQKLSEQHRKARREGTGFLLETETCAFCVLFSFSFFFSFFVLLLLLFQSCRQEYWEVGERGVSLNVSVSKEFRN